VSDPAYREAGYRAMAAALAAGDVPCHHGCGRRATSPDHVPPLGRHAHIAGSGCCALAPSCLPCQRSQGARERNRRRHPATTSRRWL